MPGSKRNSVWLPGIYLCLLILLIIQSNEPFVIFAPMGAEPFQVRKGTLFRKTSKT